MDKRILVLEVNEAFRVVNVNFRINDMNKDYLDILLGDRYITHINVKKYRLEYKESYGEYDAFIITKR
ncbi:hypothetical protein H7E67_02330 [Clostridium gasigenes]|uniref:hypothetical protein n=1 Tax=Clostridium gasigenes TaxID=94869 RepID=UPI001623F38D|nr:hypothetical protein [Clostridium gasigenes]MBB6622257.1 hypothetical protein [Clostridium gasigenes]